MSTAVAVTERPGRSLKTEAMLRMDFYRLIHTPAFYIILLISAIIPAMILCMGGDESGVMYTNAWQLVESISGSAVAEDAMDFAGYANINMVFIFEGLLMAIFVAHDYSSGFAKNIFAVHARKRDYVISKTIAGTFSGICLLAAYVFGTVIAGIIIGASFEVSVTGLIACLLSKAFLMGAFCALFLAVSVFFKNRLWLTIIFIFLLGMMLYPAASTATLSAGLLTIIMSLAAGIAGAILIGMVSTLLLNRRDLV